jgi:hypothetical protein
MMAELNKSHGAIAARIQVGGEIAQDFVRILMPLIDECRQIALGVKHGAPSVCYRLAIDNQR